jgi:hypothetical protein
LQVREGVSSEEDTGGSPEKGIDGSAWDVGMVLFGPVETGGDEPAVAGDIAEAVVYPVYGEPFSHLV